MTQRKRFLVLHYQTYQFRMNIYVKRWSCKVTTKNILKQYAA